VLDGRHIDEDFLFVIGGPAAQTILDGREGGVDGYWPRVWALRALQYAWEESATAAVLAAADDESWRVREAVAKVIAHQRLGDDLSALADLDRDPVERVRQAADRARKRLTSS
jgi:HEAT repeat protein